MKICVLLFLLLWCFADAQTENTDDLGVEYCLEACKGEDGGIFGKIISRVEIDEPSGIEQLINEIESRPCADTVVLSFRRTIWGLRDQKPEMLEKYFRIPDYVPARTGAAVGAVVTPSGRELMLRQYHPAKAGHFILTKYYGCNASAKQVQNQPKPAAKKISTVINMTFASRQNHTTLVSPFRIEWDNGPRSKVFQVYKDGIVVDEKRINQGERVFLGENIRGRCQFKTWWDDGTEIREEAWVKIREQ